MMFDKLLLNIYLYLYCLFMGFYSNILHVIGPFHFIYYCNGSDKINLTWRRYFRYGMNDYKRGVFYVKTINSVGTNHLAYHGNIRHFDYLKFKKSINKLFKRKSIMFLKKENPINFDFNLLDNYKYTIDNTIWKNNKYRPVTNLNTISKIFDLDATHIQIINLKPFQKKIVPITDTTIDMLYE